MYTVRSTRHLPPVQWMDGKAILLARNFLPVLVNVSKGSELGTFTHFTPYLRNDVLITCTTRSSLLRSTTIPG